MGYAIAMGHCLICSGVFGFNPVWVPSYKLEPICHTCMNVINSKRVAQGLPPFPIHPEAYDPCDEGELE